MPIASVQQWAEGVLGWHTRSGSASEEPKPGVGSFLDELATIRTTMATNTIVLNFLVQSGSDKVHLRAPDPSRWTGVITSAHDVARLAPDHLAFLRLATDSSSPYRDAARRIANRLSDARIALAQLERNLAPVLEWYEACNPDFVDWMQRAQPGMAFQLRVRIRHLLDCLTREARPKFLDEAVIDFIAKLKNHFDSDDQMTALAVRAAFHVPISDTDRRGTPCGGPTPPGPARCRGRNLRNA
jgi:hypothetical protein